MNKVLVLGTADWNQAIATNQHYIVRELAQAFPIIYTESMGLRTPELNLRDVRRMARRIGLGRQTSSVEPRPVPDGVEIRSPKVLPRHVGIAMRLNLPRIQALVDDWINQDGPRLLWTYTPVTYGLEDFATSIVYHCVDLLGEVDGIPTALIDTSERGLSRRSVNALGTSPVVVDHLLKQGFTNVIHWPNVADTAVIAAAQPISLRREPNRAVFAGNLSVSKVDFELLGGLIDAGVDLHLAGPIAEGGGGATHEVESLIARGAVYHGMLAPADLARLYWTARVGLIPYVLNSYTRGVSPLKTYEYLAAGLAVVATAVPSLTPSEKHLQVASSPEQFVAATCGLLASDDHDPETQADRQRIAEAHSWSERGNLARALVETLG